MMLKKTKYLMLGMVLAATCTYAQKTVVSGAIEGLNNENIFISYIVGATSTRDTVAVKDGKFTWTAEMPEPQKVRIMFPRRSMELFAESGTIQIQGKLDALQDVTITGSKTQDELNAYNKSLKDITDKESEIYQKYAQFEGAERDALDKQISDFRMQKRDRAKAYIAAHPKSAFSVSLVADRAMMGSYDDVKSIYGLLDKSAQESQQGKLLAERLVVLKRSAIGEQILDFSQNNTEGKPVSIAEFKGKYVLIDFWASWCGPCRAENPHVLKEYEMYKDKNFTVVGISLDDNADNWKKAILDDKMPWTQLSDLKGGKNEVSTYYGIRGIPSTLLIDPQGKIIAKDLRGATLTEKLAEIFK